MFNKTKKLRNSRTSQLSDEYLHSSTINDLIDKTQLGKLRWSENYRDNSIFYTKYKGFFLVIDGNKLDIYVEKIDTEDELIKKFSSEDYPHISDLYKIAKLNIADRKYKRSRRFLETLYIRLRSE